MVTKGEMPLEFGVCATVREVQKRTNRIRWRIGIPRMTVAILTGRERMRTCFEFAQWNELRKVEPRRAGIAFSPGRKPWVKWEK